MADTIYECRVAAIRPAIPPHGLCSLLNLPVVKYSISSCIGTTPFHNPVGAFRRKAVYKFETVSVAGQAEKGHNNKSP